MRMKFLNPNGRQTLVRAIIATAVLMISGPIACATGPNGPARPTGIDFTPGQSHAGNYLAGRHAQAKRDLDIAADLMLAVLKDDPDNKDLLRRAFVITLSEGRMDDAIPLAHQLKKKKLEAPFIEIALIADHIRHKRYQQALDTLKTAPERGVNGFMKPMLSAWANVGLGNIGTAIESLAPLQKTPGFKTIHTLHKGLIEEHNGQLEAAIADYLSVIKDQTGLSLRLTQHLGRAFERNGQPDKAKALYQKFMSERPGTHLMDTAFQRLEKGVLPKPEINARTGAAEAMLGIAGSLSQQQATESALVFARIGLSLRPGLANLNVLLAAILESSDRLASANRIYGEIPKNSPFYLSTRLDYADNLDRQEDTENAIRVLGELAAEYPKIAEPWTRIGNIQRRHNQYKEAVIAYDKAVSRVTEITRRHWRLMYTRGIVLERSGDWKRAEADFLKALELEKDQPFVLNYLGYSWVDRGENLDRAMAMIRKAVSLRPNDGFIVDSLGWVLYRAGKHKQAVRELERAIVLRPEDPVINDHLGDAYWQVDRRQEARFQWLRALSLDPDKDQIKPINDKIRQGLPAKQKKNGNG